MTNPKTGEIKYSIAETQQKLGILLDDEGNPIRKRLEKYHPVRFDRFGRAVFVEFPEGYDRPWKESVEKKKVKRKYDRDRDIWTSIDKKFVFKTTDDERQDMCYDEEGDVIMYTMAEWNEMCNNNS